MAQTTSQLYDDAHSQLASLLPRIQEKLAPNPAETELAAEMPQEDTMAGGELDGATVADRRLQAAQSALRNQRNMRDPTG